jgi:hypothetical protein
MTAISDWDNEYARLARAASQLRTAGLSSSSTNVASVQQGLQRLAASLESLPLAPTEVTRRRRLVQHLQQTTSSSSSTGAAGAGAGGSTNNNQMTFALQQQDAMIDELAVGVGRLKNQSSAIGDEAKMHVNLLGDMEANLDTAQAGLESETRRAMRLKEDQSVWRLQLILAGLFILLILEIMIGLS